MKTLLTLLRRSHPLLHLRRFPPTRALLRALDRPLWARIDGIDERVRVRLVSHWSFIALGTTEPKVVDTFKRVVHERGVRRFWDVGANFGFYTWLLKTLRPDAEATLFEPEPLNLELIRATASRQRFSTVTIVEAAVSDREGESTFVRDPHGASCGTIERAESDAGARPYLPVRTVRLDSIGGEVDLLKIDVEGHEERVIAGARETIARSRPVIILECTQPGRRAVRELETLGYSTHRIDHDNFLLVPDE